MNDNLKDINIIKSKSEISEGVSGNSELEDIDFKAFVDQFGCKINDEGGKSDRNQAKDTEINKKPIIHNTSAPK